MNEAGRRAAERARVAAYLAAVGRHGVERVIRHLVRQALALEGAGRR